MYGDWTRAGAVLKQISTRLFPFAKAKLYSDGELVLSTIRSHIDNQDLNWKPLAPSTVQQKGNNKIYVETGSLKDGLVVRKVKSSNDNLVLFIGASPWKRHAPSGLKMSDLMIYLEYGTSNIPPRPLIEPSFEDVKDKLQGEWKGVIKTFVGGA